MEVILLSDVEHVGLRGDVVSVARGYARNYLLPRRLAEEATPARVAELQKRDTLRARHEAKTADAGDTRSPRSSRSTVLRFEVKAGPTGSLFGSVTPTNIADELWDTKKIRVDRRKIETDPIKRIGRYEIPIGAVRGRPRRGEDRGDPRRRRAAVRRGARRDGGRRARRARSAEAAEPSVELEEILAEVDAAEAAEAEAAEAAEPRPPAEAPTRPRREAEAEPEWRADADAALAEE